MDLEVSGGCPEKNPNSLHTTVFNLSSHKFKTLTVTRVNGTPASGYPTLNDAPISFDTTYSIASKNVIVNIAANGEWTPCKIRLTFK